jgi:GNAT superfamily N-acetyltransferase
VTTRLRWVRAGQDPLEESVRAELVDCWLEVSNAGGAVGFPWPPVARSEVVDAFAALGGEVAEGRALLLVAEDHVGVAGWVTLVLNRARLTAHWATVQRLQSRPRVRGTGLGRVLLEEVDRTARDELGLEQLHLTVRGGMGLEGFYEHLGWEQVGRWPGALRLGDGDDRDEVLFVRPTSAGRSA